MIISRFPPGQPVTERAIPTPIFNTEPKIRNYFLRKWSKDNSIQDFDIRNFVDWDYYIDRFSTTVRKIITIPAGIQNIDNPVARVKEPDWLRRVMQEKRATTNQKRISDLFKHVAPAVSVREVRGVEARQEGVEARQEGVEAREVKGMEANEGDVNTHEEDEINEDMPQEDVTPDWETSEEPIVAKSRASVKRSSDFAEWLKQRKATWAESRRRLSEVNRPLPLRSTTSSQNNGYYQILEIQLLADSNVVLWAVNPTGQLQRIPVEVMHTLYLNSKKPLEDPALHPLTATLPMEQNEPNRYLYSLTVREGKVSETVDALSRAYDLDTIEGVYGSKMPAEFNMILTTGCVCRLFLPTAESSLGIMRHVIALDKKGLNMDNIVYLTSSQYPYLT